MIEVDGQDQPTLASGLFSLLIVENTQGLYRCEINLGNWGERDNRIGFLYFDRRTLDFGKPLTVKIGDEVLFEGRIMALEGHYPEGAPPTLVLLAEDRFQDLRMTRRTRTFDDVSDRDVISRIANDHGLSPEIQLDGPTYKVLAQVNQSDLAFLRERARAVEAELWMEGSTLHARSRSRRTGETLNLTYGSNLREFSVTADLAGQRTAVAVTGWDVGGKTAIRYEANAAAIANELNGDTSGGSLLQSALGERKDTLAHTVPLSSSEAQAVAEAYYRMLARRFVVGRGITETDARLKVGTSVQLSGLGPLFNGKYALTLVRHKFDTAHGLRSEFNAERPGIGPV